MSLFISLLKEERWDDAADLLSRHEDVADTSDDATGNHCLFYALGSPDMCRQLLRLRPDAIKLKTSAGNNACHVCVQSCAPQESLDVLLRHKKSCASVKNADGKVPLHFAAAAGNRASTTIIDALVAAYPSGCAIKESKNNSCPLHYACAFKAPPAVIEGLIMSFPGVTMERDCSGAVPLHLALIYGASSSVVRRLLDVSPESAALQDGKGRLPLHLAILFEASPDSVEALIAAYPEALLEKEGSGRTPLLLAFKHKDTVSLSTFELLLTQDETICCMGRGREQLGSKVGASISELTSNYAILHTAIEYGCRAEVIDLVLRVAPQAATQLSDDGKLPLHFAAWHQAPLPVVRALLRANQDAVRMKESRNGMLPLHYAAQYQCDPRTGNFLLTAYPDGAATRNSVGRLPIHLAARFKADPLFVDGLIKYHPFSVGIPDDKGLLPMDYALNYGSSGETISLLMNIPKTRPPPKPEQQKASAQPSAFASPSERLEARRKTLLSRDKTGGGAAEEFNEDEEEYEKIHHIILAAKAVNTEMPMEEARVVPFGIGAYKDEGEIKFGDPPFEMDDVFGEKVPLVVVATGIGIRGHLQKQLVQLRELNDEIRSHKETINKQRSEAERKDLEIQNLQKDLEWAKDKILRLEKAEKPDLKKTRSQYVSNKFSVNVVDSSKVTMLLDDDDDDHDYKK